MALPPINLAHAMDASWVIALYRAIHWGDPGPEEVVLTKEQTATTAAAVIEALKPFAEGVTGTVTLPPQSTEVFQRRLGDLGIEFHTHEGEQKVELRGPSLGGVPPRICPCFGPANHRKCWCVPIILK